MNDKDKAELKEFIHATANEVAGQVSSSQTVKVVHATLEAMGMDVKNPLAMQQDMAHVRNDRLDKEDTAKSIKNAAIRWSVTGAFAAVVAWLVSHSPGGVN